MKRWTKKKKKKRKERHDWLVNLLNPIYEDRTSGEGNRGELEHRRGPGEEKEEEEEESSLNLTVAADALMGRHKIGLHRSTISRHSGRGRNLTPYFRRSSNQNQNLSNMIRFAIPSPRNGQSTT